MCFSDFVQNFKSLNVCKVSDWEEVRVKGEFTNLSAHLEEGSTLGALRSKFYYELTVPETEDK
jgi:hypothetical protein